MEHNLEIFKEILSDNNVTATEEQIKEVYHSFTDHLEMMSDMRYNAHYPSKTSKQTCSNCERLESELKYIKPVSQCCGKDVYYNRDHWVCQSCNRSTIRVPKN